MNHRLNQKVTDLEISGIRQFFNRVQQYPEAVQLTLGQPDFPTPEHIKTAAAEAIVNNKTTYTANAGTMELRKAAAVWAEKRFNLTYRADSEIIVTVGASQAIDVTMRTILEPGDEVIVPAPAYPAYEPIIKQCGAEVVFIDTGKSGFKLTKQQLLEHMTKKTKAVMLPYPSNPTGAVLTENELWELHSALEHKEIFVIADEIYSELRYNGTHKSIASFPNMKEKTIVINGLSKSHSMTGWRIGFLFAHESVTRHLLKVHQYNVSCASSISQAAALAALTSGLTDPDNMRTIYDERRVWLVEQLQKASIPAVAPEGAFYIFPDISKSGLTSYEFSLQLLSEEKLAVVPGSAFSSFGEGYIRLSYAYSMSELEEAVKRLIHFWEKTVGKS
jgi:aminotransferase